MQHSMEHFFHSELHMNLLLLIGLAMFAGTIGARIFQKLRIPQVVGYIVTGLLVGELGFKLISAHTVDQLRPMNYVALGIIGFMIGGELKADIFRKYGKQFLAMVFAEGLGAFILVVPMTATIVWFFTHNMTAAIILSLVIGSISSATDPASTIQVFWEYRTRGRLTTAIVAIVALDDALALALYAISTGVASVFSGGQDISIMGAIGHLGYELCGAAALGAVTGVVLSYTYQFLTQPERLLPYTIGLILLVIGLSQALELDIILASMAFGVTLVNLVPHRSNETFGLVKKFAPPIYVLFFVFVGARLNISTISILVGCLVVGYLLARSLGKMFGVYLAAKLSGAAPQVQKYAGMCLFTQAGVAVGLSIMASQHFDKQIGDIIITVITATTFIVQLIGPAFVKLAAKKAGEIDLNITEEDLIETYTVQDVMDTEPDVLSQTTLLSDIIKKFSETEDTVYYVTDKAGKVMGSVTLEGIRNTLATGFLSDMLIADDVMIPVDREVTPKEPLAEVLKVMHEHNKEYLPVIDKVGGNRLIGVLDGKKIKHKITTELLRRRKLAEGE